MMKGKHRKAEAGLQYCCDISKTIVSVSTSIGGSVHTDEHQTALEKKMMKLKVI